MEVEQQQEVFDPKKKKKEEVENTIPELEVLKHSENRVENKVELRKHLFPEYPLKSDYEEILADKLDDKLIHSPELEEKEDLFIGVTWDLFKFLLNQAFAIHSKYKFSCRIKPGLKANFRLIFRKTDRFVRRRRRRKKRVVVGVEALKGKYVLVCCVLLPLPSCCRAWQLAAACSEMYSKLKGIFEMVLVAKMRPGWTRDQGAFDSFVQAFPSHCLVVPFSAKSFRHRLWKSFSNGDAGATASKRGFDSTVMVSLLDPNRTVLLHAPLSYINGLNFIPYYPPISESTPFPFVSRDINCRQVLDYPSPSSLQDHLCSDLVFRKILHPTANFLHKAQTRLSELNSKPVALYLYTTGQWLPLLAKIWQECSQTCKDLEIVVAYVPETCTHDPHLFSDFISKLLAKRGLPWWVAPYNCTASTILMSKYHEGERILIFEPNGQLADHRAGQLMHLYGVYAYPFTFKSILERTVQELQQITLESFLQFLELPILDYRSVGKRVLFYFDYPMSINPKVYAAAKRFAVYKGVTMKRVSLYAHEDVQRHIEQNKNIEPKYRHARDFSHKTWQTIKNGSHRTRDFFIRFFQHLFPTIIAFGKDGRICSVVAHCLPSSATAEPYIEGNLFDEVSERLNEYLKFYDREYPRAFNSDVVEEYLQARQMSLWLTKDG